MKRGSDPSRDSLKWKLKKSSGALPATLGDPTSSTAYAFDVTVEGLPLLSATLPPSTRWSSNGAGISYEDDDALFTPITALSIRHGNGLPERGKAQAQAGGSSLGLPSLFITDPITVMLFNAERECWAAIYEFPAPLSVNRYKAKQ
jgi:hypothetical protein